MYSVLAREKELEDHLISSTYQAGRPCLANTGWTGPFVRGQGRAKREVTGRDSPPPSSGNQPWSRTGTPW